MTELHLTDEQLASLADDSFSGPDHALLAEHLRACKSCQSAFHDVVRYRAMLLADASVFRAPDAAMRTARRIADTGERRERPSWRHWLTSPAALAGLSAAAMLVAAAGLWEAGYRPTRNHYDHWFQPLKQAAETASADGSIVLPGAEDAAAVTSPLHRSGFVDPDPAIESALEGLMQAYRDHPDADVAHWLITGCLATGDLERAAIYVHDARLRFPDQSRFVVLDAIVAYRTNDMARAERLLQSALETDPHNGAAMLNLALVQYESGQRDSARRTLELVRSEFRGSPLEVRAATLISDLLNG